MIAWLIQYIAPALTFLGLGGAALFIGYTHGKAKAEIIAAKQHSADNEAISVTQVNDARAASAQEIKTVGVASDAQKSVVRLDDGDAARELQSNYSRD